MDEEGLVRKREVFDSTCFSLLSHLESFEEVVAIDFSANDPVDSHEINLWEKKNLPYKLPTDLKAFLQLFNGVHVSWKVQVDGKHVNIGEININRLELIQRCALEGSFLKSLDGKIDTPSPKTAAAFILETRGDQGGQILMIYRHHIEDNTNSNSHGSASLDSHGQQYANPEIWYQDPSTRWHYICNGFTEYLRLAIVHLGVAGWLMAFTPEGLSNDSKNWMGLFCPERLCIDKNGFASEKNIANGVSVGVTTINNSPTKS